MTALAISSTADAKNAIERLYGVFEAETIQETQIQDSSLPVAIDVVDGSFTWEEPPPDIVASKKSKSTFGGS